MDVLFQLIFDIVRYPAGVELRTYKRCFDGVSGEKSHFKTVGALYYCTGTLSILKRRHANK